MKKLSYLLTLLLLVTLMTGCKAFHTLMDSKLKTAQGAPYELIVVCNQQLWESELGDTLRSVLLAPIPYLNEREPLFNVMQFPESGFKGTVVDYRNILKVLVDPSLAAASAGVQYDVTASPQVVVTLQGPTREALTQYVAEHRAELVQTFEGAERDRSIAFTNKFNQTESGKLVREKFGVEMRFPKATSWPNKAMISSGSGTNSRLRARASCSIPILTKGSSPFRRRRCWLPATVSPPAFRGRATAPI